MNLKKLYLFQMYQKIETLNVIVYFHYFNFGQFALNENLLILILKFNFDHTVYG